MADLRQQLKTRSAELHHQVDAAFSAFSLATPEGYRRFLLAHALALWPLEQQLEASGVEQLLDDWPQRRRSTALRTDLHLLGVEPSPPPATSPTRSAGWCWGALYVLEGSRLGARLLSQRLQAAQPGAPMHYLSHAQGEGFWQTFLQRLHNQTDGQAHPDLHQGVNDAFERFLAAARQHSPRGAALLLP